MKLLLNMTSMRSMPQEVTLYPLRKPRREAIVLAISRSARFDPSHAGLFLRPTTESFHECGFVDQKDSLLQNVGREGTQSSASTQMPYNSHYRMQLMTKKSALRIKTETIVCCTIFVYKPAASTSAHWTKRSSMLVITQGLADNKASVSGLDIRGGQRWQQAPYAVSDNSTPTISPHSCHHQFYVWGGRGVKQSGRSAMCIPQFDRKASFLASVTLPTLPTSPASSRTS